MSRSKPSGVQRWLAVISIAGPIEFAIVVATLGRLTPGYDHTTQLMSELGQVGAPYSSVMNTVGLPVLGLSILCFALGLHISTDPGSRLGFGPALVAYAGACMLLGAVFRCDLGCVPVTTSGYIHKTAAETGFSAMIIAPPALLRQKTRLGGHRYRSFSLTTAGITALLVPLIFSGILEALDGLIQRVMLATLLAWMEVTTLKLYRPSS